MLFDDDLSAPDGDILILLQKLLNKVEKHITMALFAEIAAAYKEIENSAVMSNLVETPEASNKLEDDLIDIEIDIQPPAYDIEGKSSMSCH